MLGPCASQALFSTLPLAPVLLPPPTASPSALLLQQQQQLLPIQQAVLGLCRRLVRPRRGETDTLELEAGYTAKVVGLNGQQQEAAAAGGGSRPGTASSSSSSSSSGSSVAFGGGGSPSFMGRGE